MSRKGGCVKARTTLVIALLVVVVSAVLSCSDAVEDDAKTERLTIAEAESLLRAYVVDQYPGINPPPELPLEERTTQDIWTRLHIQVFSLPLDSFLGPVTAVVTRDGVDILGMAWGYYGVTDMCVTDLDDDGSLELTYSYSWGSAHRGCLAMYVPGAGGPECIGAEEVCWHGDFSLEKVTDQRVLVRAGYVVGPDGLDVPDSPPIGELALDMVDGKYELSIATYDGEPWEGLADPFEGALFELVD